MITLEEVDVAINCVTGEPTSQQISFDVDAAFDRWFAAVQVFRFREHVEPTPGVSINGNDLDSEGFISFDDELVEKIETPGTLVIAEHGKLTGDVAVTTAVIDGVFKGNISATEQVVLENHAVIIGDIITPQLTIRGGAIIEGKCSFDNSKDKVEPPVWATLKGSLARVWRSRRSN